MTINTFQRKYIQGIPCYNLIKEFMDLWSCEKLLNMAEQFIGPDVAGHPVWNLRVKTPHNEATTVPWHQGGYKAQATLNED